MEVSFLVLQSSKFTRPFAFPIPIFQFPLKKLIYVKLFADIGVSKK